MSINHCGQKGISMFLPITREEIAQRGWDRPDFLYIIGDAYVDHPSFGPAIISRVLEDAGFRIAILSQPDWRSKDDFLKLGRPRLGVLVSSGNIDSMVNHYTAAKKRRSNDVYTPGGEGGKRPDRAVIVYCNRIREAFGDIPLIIGGIEASLRRFAHYDYWDDRVRRSILVDARADLLAYGMGERQLPQIAQRLAQGCPVREIRDIDGTAYLCRKEEALPEGHILLPSFETVRDEKRAYAESVRIQYEEQDSIRGRVLVQAHQDRFLVQNKPAAPLAQPELDHVYALPYMRLPHPSYTEGVPAIEEVRFSLTSNRGCFGSCNFCALAFHQGRAVSARSHASLLAEAQKLAWEPDFKGYIHDVGGPTANFRGPACKKQATAGVCKEKRCLYPSVCPSIKPDHSDYLSLLRKLRKLDGVKKVFIRSGIRFDYLMADKDESFFKELCKYHVSGQLKVAPEHVSDPVLSRMGKPAFGVYKRFYQRFCEINKELGKKQYLVPYFMSSHPGSTLHDAIALAQYFKSAHCMPEQVQDFYPTPGTVSTCMYHTGLDPFTMKEVYVPKSYEERAMQRALLQYARPENYALVKKALIQAGRDDLIGFDRDCLIRPRRTKDGKRGQNGEKHGQKDGKHRQNVEKHRQPAYQDPSNGGKINDNQSQKSRRSQNGGNDFRRKGAGRADSRRVKKRGR